MQLIQALRLSKSACIALCGSGGKTTALFQLARSLSTGARSTSQASTRQPVVVTATTHLHIDQVKLADSHRIGEDPTDLQGFEKNLDGVMLVTGPIEGQRTSALRNPVLLLLHAICEAHSLPLLIEADGSRQHPLKAPAKHEPPIPDFVETVVVVAGLSGLDQPLSEERVHRPEIFARLSGLAPGEIVTSQALTRFLTHPSGGLKNIPPQARRLVLLNQADTPDLQSIGGKMAQDLLAAFDAVIVGTLEPLRLQTFETTAGIILAAGEARRFGRLKQLLDYQGDPFVRRVAKTALAAGLSPVVVVTGAQAQSVEAVLHDLPIILARNNDWQNGQSSSIQTGLRVLTPVPMASPTSLPVGEGHNRNGVGAAIFLLADQPQVTPAILSALMEQHTLGLSPIVVPLIADQRTNPVLFDRRTFPDLMTLTGDVGGRAIFSKYPLTYLPWHDQALLLDVDTPEDLGKLRDQEL